MINTDLVLEHMDFASGIAHARKRNLPKHIDIQDLLSAAYLGLVEAAARYKKEREVCFKTFSYKRILGAINDYLRFIGYLVSLDVEDADTGLTQSEMVPAKTEQNHEDNFKVLETALGQSGSEILKMYFIDNYDLKEIGSIVGVTESRVCQILSKYKDQIRIKWTASELSALMAA